MRLRSIFIAFLRIESIVGSVVGRTVGHTIGWDVLVAVLGAYDSGKAPNHRW